MNGFKEIIHDWMEYMHSIGEKARNTFLWFEEDDEGMAQSYYDTGAAANKKNIAIEDAFAVQIGDESKKELDRIREVEGMLKFNGSTGELVPKGFVWSVSGSDEFFPEKK